MSDSPPPQAINIIQILDGRLEINESALQTILSPIPNDVQISIISVVGAFRTGKSFLLNFFLQYLHSSTTFKAEEATDEAWMHAFLAANQNANLANKHEEEGHGFGWRGGTQTCTLGIWLWSEHFIRTTATGQRVAVLLMDTQGLFDGTLTQNLTTSIFGLSTLISSHQIFNVKEKIQDDHLQHLALFSEYSKLVSRNSTGSGVQATNKSFQHLEFLVRDWGDFDYEACLQAPEEYMDALTREYLDGVFAQNSNEEVIQVRQQIQQVFDTIGCFVLPHPGTHVPNTKFDGNVQNLSKEFRFALSLYVHRVFRPDSLVIKRLHGSNAVLGGQTLFELITAYCKVFQGSELPKAQSLYETTVQANNSTALRQAKQRYVLGMQTRFEHQTKLWSAQALQQEHESMVQDCIVALQRWEMGSTHSVDLLHKHFAQEADLEFAKFVMENESRHRKEQEFLRSVQAAAEDMFTSSLRVFMGDDAQLLQREGIQSEADRLHEAFVGYYKEESKHCEYYAQEYLQALEFKLRSIVPAYLEENDLRHARAKEKLAAAVEHAKDVYLAAMGKPSYVLTNEDLLAKHEEECAKANALFSRKAVGGGHYTSAYAQELVALLSEEMDIIMSRVKQEREEEKQRLEECLAQAKQRYVDQSKALVGERKVWLDAELECSLHALEQSLLREFGEETKQMQYYQSTFCQHLKEHVAASTRALLAENRLAQAEETRKLVDASAKLYCDTMDSQIAEHNALEPAALLQIHLAESAKAHSALGKQVSMFTTEVSAAHAQLQLAITTKFTSLQAANALHRATEREESWPAWSLNLLPLVGTAKNGVQAALLLRNGRDRDAKQKLIECSVSLAVDVITLCTALFSPSYTSPSTSNSVTSEAAALATLRIAAATIGVKKAEELFAERETNARDELQAAAQDVVKLSALLCAPESGAEVVLAGLQLAEAIKTRGAVEEERFLQALVSLLQRWGGADFNIAEQSCKLISKVFADAYQENKNKLHDSAKRAISSALPNANTARALDALF